MCAKIERAEDQEYWCRTHRYQVPKVRHEGRSFFYVCPICGDDLELWPDVPEDEVEDYVGK